MNNYFMVRFTYGWCMYMYIIYFRPGNPDLRMKSDQVIVSPVGFHICMYYSCSCFLQSSPFSHTIIPHLYIFTPIFIVSPNSLGLMLFVCSWCDKKKSYLILSYLISSYLIGQLHPITVHRTVVTLLIFIYTFGLSPTRASIEEATYTRNLVVLNKINMDRIAHIWWGIMVIENSFIYV